MDLMTASTQSFLDTLDPENIEKDVTHGVCLGGVDCLETVVEQFITVTVRLGVGREVEEAVSGLERLHLQL